jgi:hypothetical protein
MVRNPTGKAVLHASLDLFRKDPQMIWLPVLASVTALLTLVAVGAPLLSVLGTSRLAVVAAFGIASIAATAATVLFNVALVFAATDRIEGRTPTVGGSLAKAWARRSTILKWAVLGAFVGTVVRGLESRLGVFGRLLGFVGAFAWTIATVLVLPVLAFEDLGPIEALRRSSTILKDQFGTVARSGLRFGGLYLAWSLAAAAVFVVGLTLIPASMLVGVPIAVVGMFCVLVVSMFASAAGVYMRTILYRFATGQSVPELGVNLSQTFSPASARDR